jgi:hypothetical protein
LGMVLVWSPLRLRRKKSYPQNGHTMYQNRSDPGSLALLVLPIQRLALA